MKHRQVVSDSRTPASRYLVLVSSLTRLVVHSLRDVDAFPLRFAERERLRRLLTRLASTVSETQARMPVPDNAPRQRW